MPDEITLTIDGQEISVALGTTLLKAAQTLGILIPTICYHDYCTANALCRLCVVEVEGYRLPQPACTMQAAADMKVHTQTPRIERIRRTILEMLIASTDLTDAWEIQEYNTAYGAASDRFPMAAVRQAPVLDDNPMFIRDYAKCVLCWRCVQVCAEDSQYTYAINFSGRGFHTGISTFFDKPLLETACVFCGQCVGVCPSGALKPKRQWQIEQGLTPNQIIQTAQRSKRNSRHTPKETQD